MRIGLVGLYLRLTNNWRPLEKSTVDEWMRKWAGERIYELMWEPLVIGKFGERYARQVNMAWLWARLKARTTRLGTFQGGFQAFANQFAERLGQMGVRIHLSTPVSHRATGSRPAHPDHASGASPVRPVPCHNLALLVSALGAHPATRLFERLAQPEEHGRCGDGDLPQATSLARRLLLV
jgi:protoporphyrinogen oxidase